MNKQKLMCLLALMVILKICPAFADTITAPPNWLGTKEFETNTQKHITSKFRMGRLEITLEESGLDDVLQKIGVGTISHQGDAGDALAWICYTVTIGEKRERVWLGSSEMGGGTITQIDGLRIDKKEPVPKDCPALPMKYLPIGFENGIWIGTVKTEITRKLGLPQKNNDIWQYWYKGKFAEFDVSEALVARTNGGKVVEITVYKITSN